MGNLRREIVIKERLHFAAVNPLRDGEIDGAEERLELQPPSRRGVGHHAGEEIAAVIGAQQFDKCVGWYFYVAGHPAFDGAHRSARDFSELQRGLHGENRAGRFDDPQIRPQHIAGPAAVSCGGHF